MAIPLFVALSIATPVSGEIFKCTAKRAILTYQNFPCEFDSLDAANLPAAPGAQGASPDTTAAASAGMSGKRADRMAVASAPRVGMTADQVRAIWGEPIDMIKEEFVKGDIETWRYADSRSVEFDRKGRVQQIRW